MMPTSEGDGRILNLPRGINAGSYADRFGSMIEFGWRISSALGHRINMIHLSVDDSSLIPRTGENLEGFGGTLGWWDHTKHGDWVTTSTDGLAARLEKMIGTIAPNALLAESSSKTLKILGIVTHLGWKDIQLVAGRENYGRTLRTFVEWLRGVCSDYSPYQGDALIPVVHPSMPADAWEDSVDPQGLVNGAIAEVMAADAFGALVNTDDSQLLTTGTGLFDGFGEANNGELIANAMGDLVDDALTYGSTILVAQTNNRELDICNLALSHIGETAAVTALDGTDTSQQATLCIQFYPEARDSLLLMRQWQFATRRRALQQVPTTPDPWQYAYVVPAEALKVFGVLPPGVSDDYAQPFWGTGVWSDTSRDNVIGTGTGQYTGVSFTIEQAGAGYRVLYTDQDEAVARYTARVVDATIYPHLFVMALSWHLASMLAGPLMKGEEGAQMAQNAARMLSTYLGAASVDDAQQRTIHPYHSVSWIAGR
jgi:hypothetical protein